MLKDFNYMGKEIDVSQLMTQEAFLRKMRKQRPTDAALDSIRKLYEVRFGMDLVWRTPAMDEPLRSAVIIPVQEGFLWLPISPLSTAEEVTYDLNGMELLDEHSADVILREFNTYADGLITVLVDIKKSLKATIKDSTVPAESLTLELPDGQVLQASVSRDPHYPALNIQLKSGNPGALPEALCFAEYNPNRPEGHRLCLCAYTEGEDEPDYYKSYKPCAMDEEETV